MGAPKQKWTSEEEDALRKGVLKHGSGKWRTIQKDPEFSRFLESRSNIDLKDKWRNLSVSAGGEGSSRNPKFKALPTNQLSSSRSLVVYAPPKEDGQATSKVVDPTKNSEDGKVPRYNAMIIEALTTMQEPNGSEIGAICRYIEDRHEVPTHFRRLLSSKLGRLVAQNKIEKIQKCYKIKGASFATKTPISKQKDPVDHSKPPQSSLFFSSDDPVEEAAITAAYRIAEAEAKSYLASEAVKEAERILMMKEQTDSILMLAQEIFERCVCGEILTLG